MIVVAATSLLWPKTMHSASPSAPNSLRVIESDDQVCQDIFTHSKSGDTPTPQSGNRCAGASKRMCSHGPPAEKNCNTLPRALNLQLGQRPLPSSSPLCVMRSQQTFRQQLASPEFIFTLILFVLSCLVSNVFIGSRCCILLVKNVTISQGLCSTKCQPESISSPNIITNFLN